MTTTTGPSASEFWCANDDLKELLDEVFTWGRAQFPNATIHSLCEHIRRELAEIERNPGDAVEYADVLLLFWHLTRKFSGMNYEELAAVTLAKLTICTQRKWGEADEHGVIEHIRDEPPAPPESGNEVMKKGG